VSLLSWYREKLEWEIKSIMKPELLIFDLDGTLVDSQEDIAAGVNYMRSIYSLPALPVAGVLEHVGQGVPHLIKNVLGKDYLDRSEEATDHYREYYSNHLLDNTVLYPGVKEALESLKNIPIALVSNKPTKYCLATLEGLGITYYFRWVLGGDALEERKPNPAPLLKIIREAGAGPENTVMVGDSIYDLQAGQGAGAKVCMVTYGYGDPEILKKNNPDFMIGDLRELPNCF
jgi:phosphoglycolate phosphatase